MKSEARKDALEMLERAVRTLAQQRAMIIKTDLMSEDEVTDVINEFGQKWGSKYDNMNVIEILLDAFEELVEITKEVK